MPGDVGYLSTVSERFVGVGEILRALEGIGCGYVEQELVRAAHALYQAHRGGGIHIHSANLHVP